MLLIKDLWGMRQRPVGILRMLGGGYPPGILHEYQSKGVVKFDCCKRMKIKGGYFLGWQRGEFPSASLGMNQNGNGSDGEGKEGFSLYDF